MIFNILKTRNGKLKNKLIAGFLNKKITENDIESIINIVEEYEKANLSTIEKLKKDKSLESKRISGALKQTINAHGPITKNFIGSATKRVYGSLLTDKNIDNKFIKIDKGTFILLCVVIFVSITFCFIF
jgi:hypothetical protein